MLATPDCPADNQAPQLAQFLYGNVVHNSMKNFSYILFFLLCIQVNGQNPPDRKQFKVDLLTIEKKSKDTLAGSIIEIYSGGKRIETDITDFDGISIFYLNESDIVDKKIRLKIYGLKCKFYESTFSIKEDLKKTIYLQYGQTEYNDPHQIHKMYEKLNIKPKEFHCGTID
ncbi:hypothetical protein OQ279_17055 [Salinimicrobium sp. MT39]|uniref:Uncharacterized protein n=1 Tax=Salinimicrobium profundisediminis TaxID=2994553 RepID=A0A9X3CZE9_9FLAO|nr:hypothetical protein [Salinimicrobium profundisediminis]MCX2839837.1 hypothetical protein [Salinimicrobium profundisediminis]